jgi:hypothetical protein
MTQTTRKIKNVVLAGHDPRDFLCVSQIHVVHDNTVFDALDIEDISALPLDHRIEYRHAYIADLDEPPRERTPDEAEASDNQYRAILVSRKREWGAHLVNRLREACPGEWQPEPRAVCSSRRRRRRTH